jgi:tellurite resistance protein
VEQDTKLLGDRRRALEEEFFRKQDEALRQKLRQKQERASLKAELRGRLGIEEEHILDALADLGLTSETATALGLVPLVEVAWADGKLEAKEREALLAVAKDFGVDPRHPSYELLAGWLEHRPRPQMAELWGDYVRAIVSRLGEAERVAMRDRMLARARGIAEAAGGILGLGKKVSPEEEVVLASLARAYDRP